MPSRVPLQNKYKCAITLKLPIEIPLSVSLQEGLADSFKIRVDNNNQDVSKVIREMMYRLLKVKDKKGIEDMMEKQINEMRDILYEKLNVNKKNTYSDIIEKEIEKYMKQK